MILCFADNGHDESLLREFNGSKKELNENFPLILFIFNNINKSISDYKTIFFDVTYINCINLANISRYCYDKKKIQQFSNSYLFYILKKRYYNYFTEGGYKIIGEINPLTNIIYKGKYLPIILIGNPGMGKSTFINVIAGERISKATSSVEPVTSKAAYYDVKISGNNNILKNNNFIKTYDYIRFIDTPGFDEQKDVDIATKEINNIFQNYEEGKERKPIILYFLSSGRSFSNETKKKEKIVKLLRLLKVKKAKLLFIITHCHDDEEEEWEQTPSFNEFLQENNMKDLVENNNSNIITCNLVGKSAFGIKKIFEKLYSCLNLIESKEAINRSVCGEKTYINSSSKKYIPIQHNRNSCQYFYCRYNNHKIYINNNKYIINNYLSKNNEPEKNYVFKKYYYQNNRYSLNNNKNNFE